MIMQWDDSLSVGVGEIDAQHRRFLDLINSMEHIKPGDRDALRTILESLIDYAAYHFSAEEAILSKLSAADEHADAHAQFVQKLLLFKRDFDKGRDIEVAELIEWSAAWLFGHIATRDKAAFASRIGHKPAFKQA